MSQPLLSISGLSVDFPELGRTVKAVRGCNLEVGAGEIMGLVGESGSGKTVTAMSCLGLVPPPGRVCGEIVLDGFQVVGRKDAELTHVRGGLAAMIFQNPGKALNPFFTVGYQIADVLKVHRGIGDGEARERVLEAFGTVHLPDPGIVFKKYPHQLSGGQLQRAMIAMALTCEPKLLIADEPTTALDVTIQAQVVVLLRELAAPRGLSILFITHDLGVVAALCDRVAVMYGGTVVELGTVTEVLGQPLHPYTTKLLASVPKLGLGKAELTAIPGQVPDMGALPPGCAFNPRCDRATEQCRQQDPVIRDFGGQRMAACFHVESEPVSAGQTVA